MRKQNRFARWADNAFSWMQRCYEHALDAVLDAGPLDAGGAGCNRRA